MTTASGNQTETVGVWVGDCSHPIVEVLFQDETLAVFIGRCIACQETAPRRWDKYDVNSLDQANTVAMR
jgi:hypothetical protein